MPYPTLHDNGDLVALDLHGAYVDEAIGLIDRTLELAARRGRRTVRIVHGSSTSDPSGSNRTIKNALYAALDEGRYAALLSGVVRMEGNTLLSLEPRRSGATDRREISILDVQP